MEQKFKLAEQARDKYYKLTEDLKKALKDKEKEVRQAKEAAVLKYRDSDALHQNLESYTMMALMMPSIK